ncbi:MAG: bile acid:sodium symporter [Thermoplasmata archaeon]|nr:bile acid:sodium symporter [Thermoplasmata archaeon]
MDRAERSRSLIRESLLGLLQDHRMEDITVSMVCGGAGVSRSTFYSHYRSLDAVLDGLIDDALTDSEPRHGLCRLDSERYECPYGICDRLIARPEYAAVLLDESLAPRVIARISERSEAAYVRSMTSKCNISPKDASSIFLFQLSGCLAVNRRVLAEGGDWERSRDLLGRLILGGLRNVSGHSGPECPPRPRHLLIRTRRDRCMDIGRLQPLIIIAAALIGLGLGAWTPLGDAPAWTVEAFLMALLFVLFLSVDLSRFREALGNRRFTVAALSLNFVLTPIIAWLLGLGFFGSEPDIRIGLLMLLVTPCTDWYLVFTRIGGGNVELGMSILPLNLVLQCLLLPVYLTIFCGEAVSVDFVSLLTDMAIVLLVPFFLSLVTKYAMRNRPSFSDSISRNGDNLQLLFLCLAVVVMFASEGESVFDNPGLLLELFVPLLIFFGLLFIVSGRVGKALRFPPEDTVSLTFTSMARNSPLALAIAVAAFPDQPLISLALVIGPLIELPVLSAAAWATSRLIRSRGCPS